MSTPIDPASQTDASAAEASESPAPQPALLEDDLDLSDVQLGERQGATCSMEEGCESCQ